MDIDETALRAHLLALMQAAPLCDYSADAGISERLGKLFAIQAAERAAIKRAEMQERDRR
jgi:hypothetical protein